MGFRIVRRAAAAAPRSEEDHQAMIEAETRRWSAATGRDPDERLRELKRKIESMRTYLDTPARVESVTAAISHGIREENLNANPAAAHTGGKVDIATLLELL